MPIPASMLKPETALNYYSRPEIQEAIVLAGKGREIAVKFTDNFGSRPDILPYPNDVGEFAKKGATSFHCSEELWNNPMHIKTEMSRQEIAMLAKGFDLVLDIDCPYWEYSKLAAHLLVKALKAHGIRAVTVKFSGNKGFHIGVPFASFPEKISNAETKTMFPELPRRIAGYLIDYINSEHTDYELSTSILRGKTVERLAELLGKPVGEIAEKLCRKCGDVQEGGRENSSVFICPSCQAVENAGPGEQYRQCAKCNVFMERQDVKAGNACTKCGSTQFVTRFNPFAILSVDTLLLSHRHMYRMPYSLHEKSGLVSLPIPVGKILTFDKKDATPEKVKPELAFLDSTKSVPNEASRLVVQAYDFKPSIGKDEKSGFQKDFEELPEAIPEEMFPPCIIKMLGGLGDGRKRALFVLTNFLSTAGWSHEMIEKRLYEWNKHNKQPLKEVYIKGHLRYHKPNRKKIPPPNCDNRMYYYDIGVKCEESICQTCKNPAVYARRKFRQSGGMTRKKK